MPKITFRPSKTLLKTAEYTTIFAVAFSSLFVARNVFAGDPVGDPPFNAAIPATKRVYIQTWDQINPGFTFDDDPEGATQKLFGMSATGAQETSGLSLGGNSGADLNGDLIELGYYRLNDGTPNVSTTNLFAGTWTPLSEKTTIGNKHNAANSVAAGEFYMQVDFAEGTPLTSGTYSGTANINALGSSAAYVITDDTPDDLGGASWGASNLWKLDDEAQNGPAGSPLLGLRFYDVVAGSTTGWAGPNGSDNRTTGTRYNTIMNADWTWGVMAGTEDTTMNLDFHKSDGSLIDADGGALGGQKLYFEFDNKYAAAGTNDFSNKTKVGSTAITTFTQESQKFMTSIAYYAGGTTSLDVSNAGIGSAIVTNFNSDAGGEVVGGTNENFLTIHSAAGNDSSVSDAPDFKGSIWVDNSNSADLTILKTGTGEQILSGKIDLADAGTNDASSYLDIHAGKVILKPDSGKTQKFEYLTGESGANLTLDNSDEGTQTIELGFANTSTTQTFSGTVILMGGGTANTIKVVSDTAKTSENYDKEQVLSGIISGDETLTKSGLGRLMLSGDNTFALDGGDPDVIINDGTLVAAHADALGVDNQVVINKGKLELGDGNNGAVTLDPGVTVVGSASGKSIVGGDGTITNLTLGDGSTTGSAATDVNVISPGRGISSSLSPSNQQVTLGTGGAVKAMGEMTVTNLDLNPGAVYDWEITDFDGGGGNAGEDWDILNVSDLDFTTQASSTFTVNVFSVASNGSAGAVSDLGVHTGNNGILFLSGGAHGNIDWGHTGTYELNEGANDWQQASYFEVDSRGYNYHNGNINGGWNVWYNGEGDFYLRYSAVPEPSTYMMVMGLLLVPGYRLFRRFRKGVKQEDQ